MDQTYSEDYNKKMRRNITKLAKQKMAIMDVLATDDGKLLLEHIADMCLNTVGVYVKDPYAVAFYEGQRKVLMSLLRIAKMDFGKYIESRLDCQIKEEEEF